jgi:hypothetical protein
MNDSHKFYISVALRTMLVFVIGLLCIGISLMYFETKHLQSKLAEQEVLFNEARIEYQKQLVVNEEMRKERDKAVEFSNYKRGQSEAEYNATLLRGFFSIVGKASDLKKKVDANDDSMIEENAKEVEDVLFESLKIMSQIMLKNTEEK